MGFPEEAGYDMLFGSCADDIDGWTEQQFLAWSYLMDGLATDKSKPSKMFVLEGSLLLRLFIKPFTLISSPE